MSRNLDYEGDLEIYPAGEYSGKYQVFFTINFDFTDSVPATRDDPAHGSEVSVNSIQLCRNDEAVECPRWLEEMILDAVDGEVLAYYAMENEE